MIDPLEVLFTREQLVHLAAALQVFSKDGTVSANSEKYIGFSTALAALAAANLETRAELVGCAYLFLVSALDESVATFKRDHPKAVLPNSVSSTN